MYRPDISLPPQLRFAAKVEHDGLVSFKLQTCADELDAAILAFQHGPTGDHLASLVGLWAAGKRALGQAGAQTHLPRNPLVPV